MNQVDPTGQRVFTTTVADGQGAFVLHWNSGQWAVGSGQLAAANTSVAPDETASDTQFTAHCPLPTAHYLDDTGQFLELAFGEIGPIACAVHPTVFGQPAPVLSTELGDELLSGINVQTSLVQSDGDTPTEWPSDHDVPCPRDSAKHAAWASGLDWLDGPGDDKMD